MDSYFYYAAYGKHVSSYEMRRQFGNSAFVVGQSALKGFELQFRTYPCIMPKEGQSVQVVIWAIPNNNEMLLDVCHFEMYGDFSKEKVVLQPVSITAKGAEHGLELDEVITACYYNPAVVSQPLEQLSLPDFNSLFKAYQTANFDVAPLVIAAIHAKTKYHEDQLAQYEAHRAVKEQLGKTDEELEHLYQTVAIRDMLFRPRGRGPDENL